MSNPPPAAAAVASSPAAAAAGTATPSPPHIPGDAAAAAAAPASAANASAATTAAAASATDGRGRTPADFLSTVTGRPVVVKLNSGVEYRGVLVCLDGYMNIALEQTEEVVGGELKARYGDAFIRGNNGTLGEGGGEGRWVGGRGRRLWSGNWLGEGGGDGRRPGAAAEGHDGHAGGSGPLLPLCGVAQQWQARRPCRRRLWRQPRVAPAATRCAASGDGTSAPPAGPSQSRRPARCAHRLPLLAAPWLRPVVWGVVGRRRARH